MGELIKPEVALLAKDKGFDEVCRCYYIEDSPTVRYSVFLERNNSQLNAWDDVKKKMAASTQSVLKKWLRDKHKLHCSAECNASGWMWTIEKTNGTFIKDSEYSGPIPESGMWEVYEEALEAGLLETLKLI